MLMTETSSYGEFASDGGERRLVVTYNIVTLDTKDVSRNLLEFREVGVLLWVVVQFLFLLFV